MISNKLEKIIVYFSILYAIICLPMVLWAQDTQVAQDQTQQFIEELIAALLSQTTLGGWSIVVGLIGCLVMFSVRAIRLFLPAWWNKLSPLGKFALPFFAAALGTAVIGVAGALAAKIALGTVVAKLVGAAIAAGFAAVTLNEGSKQVGMTFDMRAAKTISGYEPGSLRKKMSLVVGFPDMKKVHDKIDGGK